MLDLVVVLSGGDPVPLTGQCELQYRALQVKEKIKKMRAHSEIIVQIK